MQFVCPKPVIWNSIYQRLKEKWEESGSYGDPPPVRLILAGWAFSTDSDKQLRWQQTVWWAEEQGMESLIPKLGEEDEYGVSESE